MTYRNYIDLVDSLIKQICKETDGFADTKDEAETMCNYLEQQIKWLCVDIKNGVSEES